MEKGLFIVLSDNLVPVTEAGESGYLNQSKRVFWFLNLAVFEPFRLNAALSELFCPRTCKFVVCEAILIRIFSDTSHVLINMVLLLDHKTFKLCRQRRTLKWKKYKLKANLHTCLWSQHFCNFVINCLFVKIYFSTRVIVCIISISRGAQDFPSPTVFARRNVSSPEFIVSAYRKSLEAWGLAVLQKIRGGNKPMCRLHLQNSSNQK